MAERIKKASQKNSRNGGLGKSTTLINIIHFCLGREPKNVLTDPKLKESTFTLDLELAEKRYKISKSAGNKSKIFIDGDDLDEDFDLQKYVIRTLTDATDDGGILGIRV